MASVVCDAFPPIEPTADNSAEFAEYCRAQDVFDGQKGRDWTAADTAAYLAAHNLTERPF